MLSQSWGRSVFPPPHRPQSSSNDFEESKEEAEAAETVESEGGEEEEEDEEKSLGQEREVGSKNCKSSGTGGVGGEEKLGCQEEEEGST